MNELVQGNQWVWVIVQDPGGNEQFLGQRDDEEGISIIPTFLEKDEAQECLKYLDRDTRKDYEVQAIQYEELAHYSGKNGFKLFILNGSGEIIEKVDPLSP